MSEAPAFLVEVDHVSKTYRNPVEVRALRDVIGGQLFASAPLGEFNQVPNLFYVQFTVHF